MTPILKVYFYMAMVLKACLDKSSSLLPIFQLFAPFNVSGVLLQIGATAPVLFCLRQQLLLFI